MNYFEFYGLRESFEIDADMLKERFYEFSKKFHPDYFAGEDEASQKDALEKSTMNNNAYAALGSADKRREYILRLHGLIDEKAKEAVPQDFLMEMMDINEELAELNTKQDEKLKMKIENQLHETEQSLDKKISPELKKYSSATGDDKKSILKKILDYHCKKRYLLRIHESLNRIQ